MSKASPEVLYTLWAEFPFHDSMCLNCVGTSTHLQEIEEWLSIGNRRYEGGSWNATRKTQFWKGIVWETSDYAMKEMDESVENKHMLSLHVLARAAV